MTGTANIAATTTVQRQPLPSAKSTTLLKVISTSGGGTNPGFRAIEAYNAS